ncbi:MAG: redoxin domain-containing protein [Planctomycetota bacterium]
MRFASMLCACLLALGCAPVLAGSDVVDELVRAVVADIPPDLLAEPGSDALATALTGLLADDFGLSPIQRHELRLRVAGAWVDTGRSERAEEHALAVLADAELGPDLRERAGLVLVAAWRVRVEASEDPASLPDAVAALQEHGEFPATVRARAQVVDGLRQMALDRPLAAEARYQRAIALLADAPPETRVPVYALWVLAKEAGGTPADAIKAWLDEQGDDPALAQIADTVLSGEGRLVGQPAPPLAAPRLDGEAGKLALSDFAGRPVLVYFFASWADGCDPVSEVLVALAREFGDRVAIIALSLDTRDTVADLPAYIARYDIDFPIIGRGLGWDTEADEAYGVHAIPSLILIDAEGTVAAVDLIRNDPDGIAERVRQVLAETGEQPVETEEDVP